MPFIIRFFILLFFISFAACKPQKVCSGLNPEIGKFNTVEKIRKGKRSTHSTLEKDAVQRRKKQVKKHKSWGLSKTTGSQKKGIHIGGRLQINIGGKSGGGGGGGHINNNVQQRN